MLIRRINGCTEVIGEDQGYLGLPIRKVMKPTNIAGVTRFLEHVETAWEPTPKESALLNQGQSVILSVLTFGGPVPPQNVFVEPIPDDILDDETKASLIHAEEAIASLESLLIPIQNYLDEQTELITRNRIPSNPDEYQVAYDRYRILTMSIQECSLIADSLRGSVVT